MGINEIDRRLLMEHQRGLTREEIKKIKVTVIGIDNINTFRDIGSCAICLNEFKNKEKTKVLICSHAFHDKCIETWLYRARDCPLCKRNALPEDSLVNE